MQQIKNDNVAFFDVDDTLIIYDYPPDREDEALDISLSPLVSARVVPHKRHIEMIKLHKSWGNGVVVWSRSGWEWAKIVVEKLGLTDYVDAVMCKPMYYYDDKKCYDFLRDHRYQEDK